MSATWTCPVCGADVLGSFCPFQSDQRHVEHEIRREARRAALLEAARKIQGVADRADRETNGVDRAIPGLHCAVTELLSMAEEPAP